MAAKPVKNPDARAFVQDVMRRVGAETVRDLSKKLGWDGSDRETRLYAWHAGKSSPNMEGTFALLRVAGMLVSQPDEAGSSDGSSESSAAGLLRGLQGALAEIAETQAAMLDDLNDFRTRLGQLEEQPARKQAQGKGRARNSAAG